LRFHPEALERPVREASRGNMEAAIEIPFGGKREAIQKQSRGHSEAIKRPFSSC
jgi:hypothetical protein